MTNCPCGSNQPSENCCEPFISGKAPAPTPEALMRSRYTAYTKGDIRYIEKTMRGSALTDFDRDASTQWARQSKWEGLDIIKAYPDPKNPNIGYVEFLAKFKEAGEERKLHELSEFHRIDGKWYYVDGTYPSQPKQETRRVTKIGRNDPCTCGSGKKYKKCCGK